MSSDEEDLIARFAPNIRKPGPRSTSLSYDRYWQEEEEGRYQREQEALFQKWAAGDYVHPVLGTVGDYRERLRKQAQRQSAKTSSAESPHQPIPGREKARIKKLLKQLPKEEISTLLAEPEDPDPQDSESQQPSDEQQDA